MIAFRVMLVMAFSGAAYGHGRLIDPACRSSAWRFNNKATPTNWNDNELFCGGFNNQWETHRGRCGVCGDPWQGPRSNELPDGRFTTNPPQIQRTYNTGDVITTKIDLTTNHKGYFEFKLCPASSTDTEVDQDCLDKYPLEVLGEDSEDKHKFRLKTWDRKVYEIKLKLPQGLRCERCLFQWDYTTGNRWGTCPDGKHGTGCGPQETFRGCADIKIQ